MVLESLELAMLAAEAASEKKAVDIVVMDVAEQLVITSYFVIASGATGRQVSAITEEVEARLKAAGAMPRGREGEREGKWVLLDYGDLVVHIFEPEEREFYRLEKLWGDAPRIPLPVGMSETGRAQAAGDAYA